MTLEQIESIFNKLQEGSSLSLQLLKIKVSAIKQVILLVRSIFHQRED